MHMGVVPQIDERSALAVWAVTPFLLLGAFRFGEERIFACSFGGRIVGSNLVPFTAFRRCHDRIFDWNRLVRIF